jgi:hypothetical protein
MANIKFYAPSGVSDATLSDGRKITVASGYATADSKYAPELMLSGWTPATEDGVAATTDPTGSVSLVSGSGTYSIRNAAQDKAMTDAALATPGTLITDMSNAVIVANGTPASGSAGVVFTDRAPVKSPVAVRLIGDNAIRASVTSQLLAAVATDTNFKGITFWMKVKGRTAGPATTQLYLGAAADPYTGKSLALSFVMPPSDGKWHLVLIPRAVMAVQNGFVMGTDTIISIGIRDVDNPGLGYPRMATNAEEMQLGPVYVNPYSRPKFLIRFDDSLPDILTATQSFTADGVTQAWSAKMLLAQYGFGSKGSLFHLTRWIGKSNSLKTFLTVAQLAEVAALGWSNCMQTEQDPADLANNGLKLMGPVGYTARVVSSVDISANTITCAIAHNISAGLYEGYPVKFSGTNLPAPLVVGTIYWAKQVNSTDLSLFPTENDSIAGTNIIDLTTTGTAANFTWNYGYSANDNSLQRADMANAIASLTAWGYGKTAKLWAPNQGAVEPIIMSAVQAAGVKYILGIYNAGAAFTYPVGRVMNAETIGIVNTQGGIDSRLTVPSAIQTDAPGSYTAQQVRDYVDTVIATGGIGQNYHHTITAANSANLIAYLDQLRLRVAEGACDVVTGEELIDYLDSTKMLIPGVVY